MKSRSTVNAPADAALDPQGTQSPGDEMHDPSAPLASDDSKALQARAEKVCAIVLANGKTNGRFSMMLSALQREAASELGESTDAVACAVRNKWLRRGADSVELTAAGIYVAKSTLDLPR